MPDKTESSVNQSSYEGLLWNQRHRKQDRRIREFEFNKLKTHRQRQQQIAPVLPTRPYFSYCKPCVIGPSLRHLLPRRGGLFYLLSICYVLGTVLSTPSMSWGSGNLGPYQLYDPGSEFNFSKPQFRLLSKRCHDWLCQSCCENSNNIARAAHFAQCLARAGPQGTGQKS